MESVTFRSRRSSQQPNSSRLNDSNCTRNYNTLDDFYRDFTPIEIEKINYLLKVHDPEIQTLFTSLLNRIITPNIFVEEVRQILKIKSTMEQSTMHDDARKMKMRQNSSKVIDSTVPLIQINLGFGCQSQNTKINFEIDISTDKPCNSARSLDTSSKLKEHTISHKELKCELLNGNILQNNSEQSTNKPCLKKSNSSIIQKTKATCRSNKTFSKLDQQEGTDKENRVEHKHLNSSQSTNTTTPFQVNKLLNKLTSPRIEMESQTKTASMTPKTSASSLTNSKGTVEEKTQKQFLKDMLSNSNLLAKLSASSSSSRDQISCKGDASQSKSQLETSRLLNPSPSFENDCNQELEVEPRNTSTFIATSSTFKESDMKESERLEELILDSKNNTALILEPNYQNNNSHIGTSRHEGDKPNVNYLNIPIKIIQIDKGEEIDQNKDIYTSIEFVKQQISLENLMSTTQKFLKPLPHSYRLPTETEEKKNIELTQCEVTIFDELSSNAMQQSNPVAQKQINPTTNMIKIPSTLEDSKTVHKLNGGLLVSGIVISATECNESRQIFCKDIREQNQRYSERLSNPGTQLTLSYSKDSRETVGFVNTKDSSELRDSIFNTSRISQTANTRLSNLLKSPQIKLEGNILDTLKDSITPINNVESVKNRSSNKEILEQKKYKKKLNLTDLDEISVSDLSSIVKNMSLDKNLPDQFETPSNIIREKSALSEINSNRGSSLSKTENSKQIDHSGLKSISEKQPQNNLFFASHRQKMQEQALDTSRNPVLYDDLETQTFFINSPVIPTLRKIEKSPKEVRQIFIESQQIYEVDKHFEIPSSNKQIEHDIIQPDLDKSSHISIAEGDSRSKTDVMNEENTVFYRKNNSINCVFLSFGDIKEEINKQDSSLFHNKVNQTSQDQSKRNIVLSDHNKPYVTQNSNHNTEFSDRVHLESQLTLESQRYIDSSNNYQQFESLKQKDFSFEATGFKERNISNPMKATLFVLQEQKSNRSLSISDINHHLQKNLVSISCLRNFCEKNQIFAENLLDEVFRYLNEYSVSKNYFVQILTNYLNYLPVLSEYISHADISLKISEICDKNNDGIITINDLGENCLLFCEKNPESNPQASLLYCTLDSENKGFVTKADFVNLLQKIRSGMNKEQEKYSQMREEMESPESEAARLFKDVDQEGRGAVSYWDVYMWKDTFLFTQLVERLNKHMKTVTNLK